MHGRTLASVAAVAALAAAPAAHAATLKTDSPCYQETQDVVLSGSGFAADAPISISQAGKPLGTAMSNSEGDFVRKFATTELELPTKEIAYDLAATDGKTTAIARYRVTKVFADFVPSRGNPSTLKVQFTINGFGLLVGRPNVYVHYVRPNGKLARTVKLGTARGDCGKITRTSKRALFSFSAERGRWILQFDTNAKYIRATQTSKFVWVRKPVEVYKKAR